MKLCLLDFLVCLKCHRELTCYPFAIEKKEEEAGFIHYCRFWCGAKAEPLNEKRPDVRECHICHKKEIKAGLLFCSSCQSFYPVINFIPEILPDNLRDENREKSFLMNYVAAVNNLPFDPLITLEEGFKKIEEDSTRFKRAEILLTRRNDLPEGFFNPGYVLPFEKLHPVRSVERILRFMVTLYHLDLRRDDLVLDLGAGFAWTTEWLQRLGFRPVGLDLNRDYLEIGQQRMKAASPPLVVADVENLPFRPETFQGAIFFDSFHHIAGRKKAINNIVTVLKSGGRLIMADPGAGHEKHPRSQEVERVYGILEKGITLQEIEELIRGTDFCDLDIKLRAEKRKGGANKLTNKINLKKIFLPFFRPAAHLLAAGILKLFDLYLHRVIEEEKRYHGKIHLNSFDLLLLLSRDDIQSFMKKIEYYSSRENTIEKPFISYLSLKKTLAILLQKLVAYWHNKPASKGNKVKKMSHAFGEVEILLLKKKGERQYDSRGPDFLRADFVEPPKCLDLSAGRPGSISLHILNSGNTTWLSSTPDGIGEVKIGADLLTQEGKKLKDKFVLASIPQDVRPGESIRLELDLPPIGQKGEYILEFDLLAEGVMWFKDCFPNPFLISLKVQ